jgi:hypothetical protein
VTVCNKHFGNGSYHSWADSTMACCLVGLSFKSRLGQGEVLWPAYLFVLWYWFWSWKIINLRKNWDKGLQSAWFLSLPFMWEISRSRDHGFSQTIKTNTQLIEWSHQKYWNIEISNFQVIKSSGENIWSFFRGSFQFKYVYFTVKVFYN